MVDVPRLGMAVVGPGDIAGAAPIGQGADGFAMTVVEHPCHVWIRDPRTAQQRGLQDVEAFVVGADRHVDAVGLSYRRARRRRDPPARKQNDTSIAHPKSSHAKSRMKRTGSVPCHVSKPAMRDTPHPTSPPGPRPTG